MLTELKDWIYRISRYANESMMEELKGVTQLNKNKMELTKEQLETVKREHPEWFREKIEIHGYLMEDCNHFNYDQLSNKYKDPSYYKTLKLVSKDYGCMDVMLGTKHDGEEMILFGKWDDGV